MYSDWVEDEDPDAEDEGFEEPDPSEFSFCAESFEAFLCRFWLENEISFAQCLKTPLPEGARQYIEHYRRGK
jgi:hypothetical protein